MKKVILIGDSIRLGYEATVRSELAGWAEVISPLENGGTTTNVLAHLDAWVVMQQPDIVHVNAGLHDLRREFDATDNAVSLPQYEVNLEAIFRRIISESHTTLIWATTTPVNEARHHATKGFDRFEADVERYNRTALKVARAYQVPIDNLYDVIQQADRDKLLQADGVHFKPAGYELLGKAVAACIRHTPPRYAPESE